MKKTVAVIGAGISGLAAIKACKREDIDVVCFEKTDNIGGLWRYHDDDEFGQPSVMKTTVLNSHKEMSAFTDFPPPDEFPSYMHHSQLLEYIEMYADHFNLRSSILFRHQVVRVSRAQDYAQTGQWAVKAKSLEDDLVTEEIYDGVMVCTGHHAFERVPQLPGQDMFQGRIVHTHSLKTANGFEDLNVLVVGSGNSGMDAAVELSDVANQVYLSTRSGAWIVPRRGPTGLPFDAVFTSRLAMSLLNLLGWDMASRLFEMGVVNRYFDHELYGLKPKHRFLQQHPTTNDFAPTKILSGRILVRRNIKTFARNGVQFEGEDAITPIDAVVLATGYNISFPFLKEPFADIQENRVELYKHMFPPLLQHPSLAFIGLCQPNGAACAICDCQSQWFALLMKGKVKFPSKEALWKEICRAKKASAERYVDSPRHTVEVDWAPYMDSITSEYGAKPNMWKLMVCDPVLFLMCLVGPCLPYQYRLQGPYAWKGARDAIYKYPSRITRPLSKGITNPRFSHFELLKFSLPILLFVLSVLFNFYLIASFFLRN